MSTNPIQPDDPRFLLSRRLDDDLGEAERKAIEAMLAGSVSLQAEAEALAGVDRLVKSWAGRSVEVDWSANASMTRAEAGDELEQVDGLLQRWAQRGPSVGDAIFSGVVLQRIRAERRPTSTYGFVYRLGLPLAAAAALALAVVGRSWFLPLPERVCIVDIRPSVEGSGSASSDDARVVVSFAMSSDEVGAGAGPTKSIGFLTLGAEPLPGPQESWPL